MRCTRSQVRGLLLRPTGSDRSRSSRSTLASPTSGELGGSPPPVITPCPVSRRLVQREHACPGSTRSQVRVLHRRPSAGSSAAARRSGPGGRRSDSALANHAILVQRPGHLPPKQGVRVRFPRVAPTSWPISEAAVRKAAIAGCDSRASLHLGRRDLGYLVPSGSNLALATAGRTPARILPR